MSAEEMPDAVAASPRDHSLDAARGVMMVLGIVLHTSNVYSQAGDWLVADPRHNPFFDLLSDAIHVFRMPMFFWISGYFVAMTFERSGAAGLLRNRLRRILVPLATTWITLNVLQEVILAIHANRDPWAALRDGVPAGHLWFLLDLCVFILAASVALPQLWRRASWTMDRVWEFALFRFAALTLVSYAAVLAVRATGAAYVDVFDTNLFDLASYAPFFAAGILMHRRADIRARFLDVPAWSLLVALPLATVAVRFEVGHGRIVAETAEFVSMFGIWVCVAALLDLFRRVFDKPTVATRFLSEASYSIYLFHHVLVVALGIALMRVDLSPFAKFTVVCVAVFSVTSLIHVTVVRRIPLMRLLYNGR